MQLDYFEHLPYLQSLLLLFCILLLLRMLNGNKFVVLQSTNFAIPYVSLNRLSTAFFSSTDISSKLFDGTSYSKVHYLTGTCRSMQITFLIKESASLSEEHASQAFCPGVALAGVPTLGFVHNYSKPG